MLAFGSDVATWSTSAAGNNSAPPDGAPEGMAPSTVNDAMREIMASVARWYSDSDGTLITAGTGNAYLLTTNATHAALADIPLLTFRVNRANTGAATLNVDGLGVKDLRANNAALDSGFLAADNVISVAYNATTDDFDIVNALPQVNAALLDQANTFTDTLTLDSGIVANIRMIEADAGVDEKNWRLRADGDRWTLLTETDLLVDVAAPIDVFRLGTSVTEIQLTATTLDFNGSADISGSLLLGTALAIAEGGTQATTVSGARTNLGLAIGSDVQQFDVDLAAIAGLAQTDSNFIVGNGSTWVAETGATARTSIGLGTANSPQLTGINLGHATDTTLTRASAGVVNIEGATVWTSGNDGTGTGLDADTLDGVEAAGFAQTTEGSFTVTYDDGCTALTAPTHTWNYVKNGNLVTIDPGAASAFQCTSDSTAFGDITTPVPAALRPTTTVYIYVRAMDLGSAARGCLTIEPDGDVVLHQQSLLFCTSTWSNAGLKGAFLTPFSYVLNN